MWHTLAEMGHLLPLTPVQTDNSTAYGIIINKIIPKATKAMDMCFHWLFDHKQQKQFRFYWPLGKTNYMDYWTKHHPTAHHKLMQHVFLTPSVQLNYKRSNMQHSNSNMTKMTMITTTGVSAPIAAVRVCWNL